jgi:hypothetical protein
LIANWNNKTVTLNGVTLGGTNVGNYTFTTDAVTSTANITPKTLTISGLVANNTTYNGTTAASISDGNWGSVTTGITGEALTLNHGSASYDNANAGTGKTVTASGYNLANGAGGLAGNYQLAATSLTTTANVVQAALSISSGNVTKTYDGGTSAAGTATVVSGTLYTNASNGNAQDSLSGGTFAFTDKSAGTENRTVTATGVTINDGNNGGNYTVTYVDDATSRINKKDASVSGSTTSKTYNGLTQNQDAATTTGFISGDAINVSGESSGKNAGSYTSSLSVSGTDKDNYNVTITNADLNIAKANATVTASSATVTYNSQTQSVSGITASGLVNGETTAVLTGITEAGGSGRNAGSYAHTASGTDSNYELTFVAGALAVGRKDASVSGTATTKTYNGLTQNQDSATTNGFITGDAITVNGESSGKNAGSYTSALSVSGNDKDNYNVTITNADLNIGKANATVTANSSTVTYNSQTQSVSGITASGLVGSETTTVLTGITESGGSGRNAGNYAHTASGTDSNYNLTFVDGSLTINKKDATVSGTTTTKTYNGLTQNQDAATTNGFITGDAITVSGESSGKNAGSYTSALSVSGNDKDNYNVTITNADLKIYKANATVTANSNSVTYNSQTQSVSGITATGLVNGETTAVFTGITESGGSGRNAGSYLHTANGTDSNYNLTFVDGSLTINKKDATASGVATTKTYNGLTQNQDGATTNGFITGDAITVSGESSGKNAGTYSSALSVSGNDKDNYNVTITNADLKIDKANATVTANSNSVTYNSQTQSVSGITATGLVNGETTAVFTGITESGGSARNAGNYAHTASGTDSNYNLTFVDGSLTINKKDATVSGTATTKTYNGLTQNQDAATTNGFITGDAITVSGEFSGKNAGSYTSALSVSGNDKDNYNVTITNADLKIDKANATVTANSNSVTYNSQTQSVSGITATGLVNGETTAVFTGITESGGSGRNAGSYLHTANGTDGNYNLTFVDGSLSITKKDASVSGTATSKTYNGLTQNQDMATATGFITGDAITVSGESSGKNAGTYSSALSVSGNDKDNYNVTITNADLTIDKKNVTATGITANNKTYDGNTLATLNTGSVAFTGMVADDRLGIAASTSNFIDKNVGTGKTVTITGLVLDGADAGNYSLANTTANTTATITRLNSVTWTGGSTGNWLDSANWAGGAVPDLSNVANVVIPNGTTVSFGGTVLAPAQSGAVNIDGLTGGNLTQSAGTLNVGTSGITLGDLTQSGGVLSNSGTTTVSNINQSGGSFSGTGPVTVDNLAQTGGSFHASKNLTVNQNFSQGTSGTVDVGGTTSIADVSGGVQLGNLNSTGPLTVNSTDGAITQANGTAITANTSSSFTATQSGSPADITLANSGNDFIGTVSASSANIALTDTNVLTLGTVTTSGGLNLTSSGALDLGTSNAGGNLSASSGNGNIAQIDALTVTGTSNLNAGSGNVTLNNAANDFGGAVTATGNNVNLADANTLSVVNVITTGNLTLASTGNMELGNTTVGGNLIANSVNGTITQNGMRTVAGSTMIGVLPEPPVQTQPAAPAVIVAQSAPAATPSPSSPLIATSGNPVTGGTGAVTPQPTDASVKVSMTAPPTLQSSGIVTVTVPGSLVRPGASFAFPLPEQIKSATTSVSSAEKVSLPDGAGLPGWLKYDRESKVFTASNVPSDGLPIKVLITAGGQSWIVDITLVNK